MKTLKKTLAVIVALFITVIVAYTVTVYVIEFINLLNDNI